MEDAVWSVDAEKPRTALLQPGAGNADRLQRRRVPRQPDLLTDVVHPDDHEHFIRPSEARARKRRASTWNIAIVRRDGAVRWVHNRFWVVRNAAEVMRVDGIMTDITDRREASEQAMQLAIERERVRILSDFVRDASHEFRTPLSVINTRLYLMEKISDPERQHRIHRRHQGAGRPHPEAGRIADHDVTAGQHHAHAAGTARPEPRADPDERRAPDRAPSASGVSVHA